MTNEAAERLRDALANGTADREGGILTGMLDQALAAERRATVERIRHATILPEKWLLTSDGKEWVDAIPVNNLVAILDAEADR